MNAILDRWPVAGQQRRFRALDPELPILAARAALQLDRLILSEKPSSISNLDAVESLAELMSQVGANLPQGGSVRALMDPVSATVFSRAYSEASSKSLTSYQELEEAVRNLSQLFENIPKDQMEDLTMLRDFCIFLSDYAASQRQSVFGGRVSNQYKK